MKTRLFIALAAIGLCAPKLCLADEAKLIRHELGDVRTKGSDQREIQLSNPQER